MLEAELDPGPEAETCRAKSSLAARRERQKTRAFTTIKMGLRFICKNPSMLALLETCVPRCSIIASETSLLATLHATRILEAGTELERIDQTFFDRCLCAVANIGIPQQCGIRDPELVTTMHEFMELLPAAYQSVERLTCMTRMLNTIARQMHQNFSVSVYKNLIRRLARWLRLKIQQHAEETGTDSYFHQNEQQIVKSVISILTRACTDNTASVDSRIDRLIAQYRRFQENQFPIPPAELAWMKSLCAEVRTKIGPLPLRTQSAPHPYLPFLYAALRDLEAHNLDVTASNEDGARGFKLFSMLPQKKLRPTNISIDNSTMIDMHSKLLVDMEPNRKRKRGKSEPECANSELKKIKALRDKELWTHYFKVESSRFSGGRKFETFITTDGLSASVVPSRPKCDPAEAATATEDSDAERMRVLLEGTTRAVAVDPGRNPVLTAVAHNEHALEELRSPGNTKSEVVNWSRGRFHYETGHKYRNKTTARWIDKGSSVSAFNKQVGTARTGDLTAIRKRVTNVLANCRMVLEFFCAQRFKRLRWKTYIQTQKTYEKIVADLNGGCEKTLVVWGDAHFPANGRRSPSVPTSTLR